MCSASTSATARSTTMRAGSRPSAGSRRSSTGPSACCSTCRARSCAWAPSKAARQLEAGARFRLDMDDRRRQRARAAAASRDLRGAAGRHRRCCSTTASCACASSRHGADFAETTVLVGGPISDRKGVNVPSKLLPISPLTAEGPRRPGLRPRRWASTGWRSRSCSAPRTSTRRARSSAARLDHGQAREARGHRAPRRASSRWATASMVARAATSAWSCRPSTCPNCSAVIVRACRKGGKPVVVAHADARIDDRRAGAHARRGVGRGDRDLRRRRRGDALGRIGLGQVTRSKPSAMMDRIIARVRGRSVVPRRHRRHARGARCRPRPMRCASMRQVAARCSRRPPR